MTLWLVFGNDDPCDPSMLQSVFLYKDDADRWLDRPYKNETWLGDDGDGTETYRSWGFYVQEWEITK